MMPPTKILLALQFWGGDKEKAMQTARLIADLEPRHSDVADFLFVSRFDCAQDMATVEYVSRKFNVHAFVNRNRRGDGWPFGPNELWFGTVDFVYTFAQAGKLPLYKAVLTFEADAYPLVPNWIRELHANWDRASAKGVKMLGALQQSPGEHINGNCLVSCDFEYLHWISRKVGGCNPHGGWDYVLRKEFKSKGWSDCPAIKSYWGSQTMDEGFFNQLVGSGVVFCHGIKDDSVVKLVRRKFLPGT